jgi:hypothetical protein
MLNTDEPIYRVVVVRKAWAPNPKYRGRAYDHVEKRFVELSPGETPFVWSETETRTTKFGPYESLGTARGILTRETVSDWKQEGIISADIEVGRVIWEKEIS